MAAVIAICLGACLGALARWQLSVHFNTSNLLPWGTLYANLIGGYLIGVCVGVFQQAPELDPLWRMLLVTGFLGALTTFFIIQQRGGAYAFNSLLCTLVGIKTVEWLWLR